METNKSFSVAYHFLNQRNCLTYYHRSNTHTHTHTIYMAQTLFCHWHRLENIQTSLLHVRACARKQKPRVTAWISGKTKWIKCIQVNSLIHSFVLSFIRSIDEWLNEWKYKTHTAFIIHRKCRKVHDVYSRTHTFPPQHLTAVRRQRCIL